MMKNIDSVFGDQDERLNNCDFRSSFILTFFNLTIYNIKIGLKVPYNLII